MPENHFKIAKKTPIIANGACITTRRWFTPVHWWNTLYCAAPGNSPSVIHWFTLVNHWNTACNALVYSKLAVYIGKLADYTSYLV